MANIGSSLANKIKLSIIDAGLSIIVLRMSIIHLSLSIITPILSIIILILSIKSPKPIKKLCQRSAGIAT